MKKISIDIDESLIRAHEAECSKRVIDCFLHFIMERYHDYNNVFYSDSDMVDFVRMFPMKEILNSSSLKALKDYIQKHNLEVKERRVVVVYCC